MKKLLKYLILLVQIIVLLLVPRFGWHINHPDVSLLNYESTYRENGYTHTLYSLEGKSVDIAYNNRFSRHFYISVDGGEPSEMTVFFDGGSEGSSSSSPLPYTGSAIVWKDSSGIFYRVYLFALGLTFISLLFHNRANRNEHQGQILYNALSVIALGVSFLISFRIIL